MLQLPTFKCLLVIALMWSVPAFPADGGAQNRKNPLTMLER